MVKPPCSSRVFLDHVAQDCVLFTHMLYLKEERIKIIASR